MSRWAKSARMCGLLCGALAATLVAGCAVETGDEDLANDEVASAEPSAALEAPAPQAEPLAVTPQRVVGVRADRRAVRDEPPPSSGFFFEPPPNPWSGR